LQKKYLAGINASCPVSNHQKIKNMKRTSWKWLLSLGLATVVSLGAMAQGHGGGHHRGHDGHDKYRYENSGKKNLSDKVYRVTQADSLQKQKMKPAVDRASKRLESLRLSYQKQEKRVMDSLSLQVKPYLKEEQLKKLNDWKDKTGK
jgi:hypothetical protein